jgi:hypothetical protein
MEFIDKTVLETRGEAIVTNFLRELKAEGATYPRDLYDTFKSAKNDEGILLKDLLTDLLMEEQHNYCCYCMRKLDAADEEKTVEHLIPNKIKSKKEFDTYLNSETVLNDKTVCWADEFIEKEELNFPPYPHSIAYHNLSISCNGKISRSSNASHCNLKRGNKYVKPFILHPQINKEFEYNTDGFVHWEDEQSIDKLGLNTDLLRMIRRIWFYANKKESNLLELNDSQRNKFLIELEKEVPDDEWDMLFNFKSEPYWNLLKKYNYFASYKLKKNLKKNLKKLARQLMRLTVTEIKDLIEIINFKYAIK